METFKDKIMRQAKYFDHILGEQNRITSKEELKMFKRIINSHLEDYSEEEKNEFSTSWITYSNERIPCKSNKKNNNHRRFFN